MNEHAWDAQAEDATVFDTPMVRAFHGRLCAALDTEDLESVLAETQALEEVKNAICARQARLAVEAHRLQRTKDVPRGIKAADSARLAGSQVALARLSSPHLGSRYLGLAHAVVEEMPHTFQALSAGVISERDVTDLVSVTACLTREDRAAVDAAIADQLGTASHRALIAAAQSAAYQADPEAFTRRRAKAESERRVSLRPAPDCMTWLTALLPVKDGVACYAALKTVADATATAEHPRGQVMADTLVERVTGRSPADGPDVQVDLVMPVDTLTGDTPAYVPDYGPIPADLAREWVGKTGTEPGAAFGLGDRPDPQIRRLFAFPGSGDLIGMESRARTYPGLLAKLIALRDQTCRTPHCDAPIRHTDHLVRHADGGRTSERNGDGLCERCNYVKEHPDYHVTGDATEITVTTGGLVATSHPPAPPGMPPPTRSAIDRRLIDLTWQFHLNRPARVAAKARRAIR